MILTLDIETNTAHDKIWCCGVSTGVLEDSNGLQRMIDDAEVVVGHNIIGFDAPLLRKLWGIDIPEEKLRDTLILSRLYDPPRTGGHSLAAWGETLGSPTGDFDDYDGGLCQEMIDYCQQDVEITVRLYKHLMEKLANKGFKDPCISIEHKVASITKTQVDNGFLLDTEKATEIFQTVSARMFEIERELQEKFQPIVTERWSEKTGKQLKDKVEVFNVGSRQQIAKRLQSIGVKLNKRTEKTEKGGGGNIIVDEETLEGINVPEAQLIGEYLMLQKRASQVDSWFKYTDDNNRVHGRVITNGAVTGRMTHSSPNLAQIPATGKPFGKECRQCWTVPAGSKLVGIDASGLELRMLAHYMDDDAYTAEVLDGDIHTANMNAAGLTERSQAKTFIYAFLYGAGAGKIGSIVGGSYVQGQKLIDAFLENTPALKELKAKVARLSRAGILQGLDGRQLRVRSEHSALNTLLQGAGAIVMKQALINLNESLTRGGIPFKLVANVHDEWQIETPEYFAPFVGKAGVIAIEKAGIDLELRCPLTGEYNIGVDWSETH
jgi:DNA polymerase I-like protein with 3'-5' exonuclease and polymerase domains